MGLQQTITYDVSGNFSFDSNTVEFAGGLARLKDLKPANATFFTSFQLGATGDYGNGTLAGTLSGATILNALLDCRGGVTKYCEFPAPGNLPSGNVMTVEFDYIPNYSGAPAAFRSLFAALKANTDTHDVISLQHEPSGAFALIVGDGSGATVVNADVGSFSPVAGQTYRISLNLDGQTGATRIFVGPPGGAMVQVGTTITTTWTSGASRTVFRVGGPYASGVADGQFSNLIVYSTIQHTANYTAGPSRTTQYSQADPSILVSSGVYLDGLESFAATLSAPTNSAVKFQLMVDGLAKWWNGTAWASSDGTFAQSNTASEIDTNKAALDLSTGHSLQLKAILHSSYGTAQPSITQAIVGYNFFQPEAAPPECIIYGYVLDVMGVADPGTAKIIMELEEGYFNGSNYIKANKITIPVNAAGYFEQALVESTAAKRRYTVSIQYGRNGVTITEELGSGMIPNQTSASLQSIL